MGDSATSGYITPSGTNAFDTELEDIFQSLIVGITNLSGKLVRPRWLPEPLAMPEIGVNWCAYAVRSMRSDAGPVFIQNDEDTQSVRHEEIEVLLSFYGNQGQSYASIFKDGLGIPQNIAQIRQHKIKFVGTSEIITAPDLLNQQYVHRYDLVATFRRKTERVNAIKKLLDYQVNINRN